MNQIITALFLLLRAPLGPGKHRKALRRRHFGQLLRTLGVSRRKAERFAHRIP